MFALLGAAAVAHAQSFVDNGKGMIWQFEFRNLFQSKSEGVKQRVLEELSLIHISEPTRH